MPRSLTTLFKVAVSAVLVGWFLLKNDTADIFRSLSRVSVPVFLAAVGLSLVAIFFNSYKWRLLLPQYRLGELFRVNLIGQYYSLLLPGQIAGEVAKAFHLSKGSSTGAIAASITIDKITGLTGAVFIVGLVGILMTSMAIPKTLVVILMLVAIADLVILYSIRLPRAYGLLRSMILWVGRWISAKFSNGFLNMLETWRLYASKPSTLFASIGLGVLYQMFTVVVAMLIAGNIGISISFFDWCWMLSLLSVALLLPITLGGLGLREATLVGLLALFSVPTEMALALSFALFGVQILISIIGGLASFGGKRANSATI